MKKRWADEIKEALEALGGTATYSQLYAYIKANTSRQLTKAWDASVRQTIESHSSDSDNYLPTNRDLFYSVAGKGSGTWGLRSMRQSTASSSDRQPAPAIKEKQDLQYANPLESKPDQDLEPINFLQIEDIDLILDEQVQKLESAQEFDPDDITDARERTYGAIVRRRGQGQFRTNLLRAYLGQCAITRTALEDILESAHILAYKGPATNHVSNGLLLRADIHTLFDLRLIAIDTATMTVLVSPRLQHTEYAALAGRPLYLPASPSEQPSKEALDRHRSEAQLA